MRQRGRAILKRLSRRDGQTMTEYALILGTIAVVLITLLHTSGAIVSALVNAVVPLL